MPAPFFIMYMFARVWPSKPSSSLIMFPVDYVSGKNATDMALVIDTIELLHTNIYDAFVIVSSDSDYTPLAIKLHESGVHVMGIFSRGQSRISIAEPMGTQS